jgi:hypothetical protein
MQATNDQCTDLQITQLSAVEGPPNDLPPVVAITVLVAVFVVVPLIYGLGLGHQYPGTCSPTEALGRWLK